MEKRTLVYESGRRSCLSGYYTLPTFPSGLSWDLPALPAASYRNVYTGGRHLLLWSPNSSQIPFLPGIPPFNLNRSIPPALSARRYNGSYGRFDPSVNPQFVNMGRPFWPFIRRENRVQDDDPLVVVFRPFVEHWNDEGLYSRRGSLNTSFIDNLRLAQRVLDARMTEFQASFRPSSSTWASRPRANAAQIFDLAQVQMWENAVDYGVALQRTLKEMEAWVAWRRAVAEQARLTQHERLERIGAANDDWMGCWINELPEDLGLNFLAACVPCFVVHEYEIDEDLLPGVEFANLLTGTEVEHSLSDSNPYQAIARRRAVLDSLVPNDPYGVVTPSTSDDCRRSSLAYQRRQLSTKETARAELATSPGFDESMGEGSAAAEDPTITTVNRPVHWIEPPPVQRPPQIGKWEKFELEEVGGRPGWIFRGRNYDVEAENEWFDRSRKRRLFMGPLTLPEGVFNAEVFGAPVPDFPFWFPGDGRGFLPAPRSTWMYQRAEPRASDVGRRAVLPLSLPREVEEEKLVKKDKGKGKAIESDEEEDEFEGMEVDEPRIQDVPSPVVVLDNVDDGLSAATFYAAIGPFLQTMRSHPIAITRARGRMWIQLPNIEEARRAYGVFLVKGPARPSDNLAVEYAPLGDFEEARRYSQDCWDVSMEQNGDVGMGQLAAEDSHPLVSEEGRSIPAEAEMSSEMEEGSHETKKSVVAQPALIGTAAADAASMSPPPPVHSLPESSSAEPHNHHSLQSAVLDNVLPPPSLSSEIPTVSPSAYNRQPLEPRLSDQTDPAHRSLLERLSEEAPRILISIPASRSLLERMSASCLSGSEAPPSLLDRLSDTGLLHPRPLESSQTGPRIPHVPLAARLSSPSEATPLDLSDSSDDSSEDDMPPEEPPTGSKKKKQRKKKKKKSGEKKRGARGGRREKERKRRKADQAATLASEQIDVEKQTSALTPPDAPDTIVTALNEGTSASHVAANTRRYWEEDESIPLYAWFEEDFPEEMMEATEG